MALMLCDKCYEDQSVAYSDPEETGGWRLQRVSPVVSLKSPAPRRQLALAAVAAGSPQTGGGLRSWWNGLFGR
ncbi:MAG: hypothetical protein NTZ05_21845 [Chloroflexi bacterium]|nr:hypothetical protein [Chloroflexota bacterium]